MKYENISSIPDHQIEIAKFAIHVEEDEWSDNKKVLAIENENGNIYVSTSKSFIREFETILEVFGSAKTVLVTQNTTSNGYEVLGCRYIG